MQKLICLLLSASIATAEWRWGPRRGKHSHMLTGYTLSAPVNNYNQTHKPVHGYKHIYQNTFQQNLDHGNASLGTFSQTYYWDNTYYKGPGYPVIMFAPQEANASDYLALITDTTVVGELAQRVGGATILMEHRYWGNSSPYPKLTTENMQYLTLENAIADCTNFARNVILPFAPNGSNADVAPWILIGGSYSGALTAWVEAKAPGTFWAYLASSAVVQAVSNLWEYFKQIEIGMPRNCSADVQLVVNHMDNVIESGVYLARCGHGINVLTGTGNTKAIIDLKQMFGLEKLEHNDDFMEVLANGPYLWQNPSYFVSNAPFYEWCDYVENSVNVSKSMLPGPGGVGLEKAMAGYAKWVKRVFLPGYCEEVYGYFKSNTSVKCFDTHDANSPIFTDTSVSNTADRQWEWMLCNQPFGYWQDGAPQGMPTLVSRLVDVKYFTRQCGLYYPPGPNGETYGIAKGMTEKQVNTYTGGWFIDNTTRLIYANGEFDPWRDATVSSLYRPGGPLASTSDVPVYLVPEGNHVSDLLRANANANAGVMAIQQQELAQLQEWISQFATRNNTS